MPSTSIPVRFTQAAASRAISAREMLREDLDFLVAIYASPSRPTRSSAGTPSAAASRSAVRRVTTPPTSARAMVASLTPVMRWTSRRARPLVSRKSLTRVPMVVSLLPPMMAALTTPDG